MCSLLLFVLLFYFILLDYIKREREEEEKRRGEREGTGQGIQNLKRQTEERHNRHI